MRSPLQLLEDSFKLITGNLSIYATYAVLITAFSIVPLYIHGEGLKFNFMMDDSAFGPGYFLLAIIMSFCTAGVAVAMLKSFSDGVGASFESSISFVKAHYVKFITVCILYYIAMIIGFILLIIPGFLVAFFFVFAPIIVLFEERDGIGALRRSFEYVTVNVLSVLWRFVVFIVLSMLLSIALNFAFLAAVFEGFGGVIALTTFVSTTVNCLFAAYMYNMYVDMRTKGIPAPVVAEATVPVTTEGTEATQLGN
jgi:hypothetical protein